MALSDAVHVTLAEYVVILLATGVGATVQGTIGFGANLIAVPVLALLAPEALPGTTIVWAAPLAVAMALRERDGVDWSGVRWTMAGRFPGTAIGAWVVAVVAPETLSVVCGVLVLVAVGMSIPSAELRLTPATKTAAGFTSGLMGTATSIGGPPMALLYQHHEGRSLRATLAVFFAAGTVLSLVMLAVAGALEAWQVTLAVALTPGLVGGLLLSPIAQRHLAGRALRPAVLGFAALASVAAVVQGLS